MLPLISGASKDEENTAQVFVKLRFLKFKMVKHRREANEKEETRSISKEGVIKDISQF